MIPLQEAVAILARVAASDAPADETALHLRVVRALDVFSARGLPVAPERAVPRIAAAHDEGSLLDLLVALLTESDRTATAVVARARELCEPSLPAEASAAVAFRRVVVDPALAIGRYLPREAVLQNDFRREELVRAWAAAIDVPIDGEDRAKSARALERLDYRRIRADEERLQIERRVLAEHAEAVREKQRLEAEALASAQRE